MNFVASLLIAFIISAVDVLSLPRHTSKDTFENYKYQSCHPVDDKLINVHLVPHTHDDVGWLKNIDQYYYGSRSRIQKAAVGNIIDSVIASLERNKNRKFIYVETAFFWQWWQDQNDEVKEITRSLVNSGQLEFAGGGWCMNDEGTTHYHSLIDQMSWGLKFLNDTFGEIATPKVGWQIDPFGHSKGMAQIFALLGFDGFVLNRIDFEDIILRKVTNSLEMIWRSSANIGGETSDIFTSVLPRHYEAPDGFCFDMVCNDEPIIDNPRSPENNVDEKVTRFMTFLDFMYRGLTTNNILITMGRDFSYHGAESWFKNIDKLIKYTNQRQVNGSRYNLLYSTPACYVKAVYDASKGKMNYPVKEDDFMPYGIDGYSYWNGYFTSRPTLKRFEREGNNFLQICKQLSVIAGVKSTSGLDTLRDAMGVLQHHDAVSGTEKQAVANDYARRLYRGIESCGKIIEEALSKISASPNYETSYNDNKFINCPLLNISQCSFTENNDNFVVTIYNPLSRFVTKFVRLPVQGDNYSIKDSQGQEMVIQLQPINEALFKVPGRNSSAKNELIFVAIDVPPLGFESFYVERLAGNKVLQPTTNTLTLSQDIGFSVDSSRGLLTRIFGKGFDIPMSQSFGYYFGASFGMRASGAYIFRPDSSTSTKVADGVNYTLYQGSVVSELHQVFNGWVSQVVRVYPCENFIEFQWMVGPVPDEMRTGRGKEVISIFKTPLNNNGTFYTDSNGRELLKRIRNSRPTYDIRVLEKVAANYYPVTSKIIIKDEEKNIEFAVLTDRSEGGSSIQDGEIELMVHRRCLHDDGLGVTESLREEAFGKNLVARGSHYVVVGPIQSSDGPTSAALQRDIAQRKLLDSWIFLSPTEGLTFEEYKKTHNLKYNGLTRTLPDNVQILTLEPWNQDEFLIRLEHVFEKNEDPNLSKPVVVDLKKLFASFEIVSMKETTLGGNQWLEDSVRLMFDEGEPLENFKNVTESDKSRKILDRRTKSHKINSSDNIDELKIELHPMEIRSFIIKVQRGYS